MLDNKRQSVQSTPPLWKSVGRPIVGGVVVKSINFEFLRKDWPELASLAGFAEQYAVPDPSGSLVKLRSFIEQMVESIYERFGLQRPHQANLIDLLDQTTFQDVVPRVVVTTMHAIRVHGN